MKRRKGRPGRSTSGANLVVPDNELPALLFHRRQLSKISTVLLRQSVVFTISASVTPWGLSTERSPQPSCWSVLRPRASPPWRVPWPWSASRRPRLGGRSILPVAAGTVAMARRQLIDWLSTWDHTQRQGAGSVQVGVCPFH